MKSYLYLTTMVLFLIYLKGSRCSATKTDMEQNEQNKRLADIASKKLGVVWRWLKQKANTPDSFIGRCLGAAKGLKVAMPIILFKLGVIVTIVSFIAIFSLKSLGLLATLLFINLSGFFSRFARLGNFAYEQQRLPQNVHYHMHNKRMSDPYSHVDRYFPPLSSISGHVSQEEWLNQKYQALNSNRPDLYDETDINNLINYRITSDNNNYE